MPHGENCVTIHPVAPEDYEIYVRLIDEAERVFVPLEDGREGLWDWDFNVLLVADPELSFAR